MKSIFFSPNPAALMKRLSSTTKKPREPMSEVWNTVKDDIPVLRDQIDRILKESDPD